MRRFQLAKILFVATTILLAASAVARSGALYVGLRFGMSQDEVREKFKAVAKYLEEAGPGAYKFDRPPVEIEGVDYGFVKFRNKKLYEIILMFDQGIKWEGLEKSYRSVNSRISSKYGTPSSSDDKISWLESIREVEKPLAAWWRDDGVTISLQLSKKERLGWHLRLFYTDDKIAAEKEEGL